MFLFLSTTSNCPAPPTPSEPTEQQGGDNGEVTPSTSSNADDEVIRKCKTKSELACEEQFNKLLKVAQQEDHPVELALCAIGKQMIRSFG